MPTCYVVLRTQSKTTLNCLSKTSAILPNYSSPLWKGQAAPDAFASELPTRLAAHATEAERELITQTAAVIRITHSFNTAQRAAMARCVSIMAEGMVFYQGQETLDGVENQAAMDRYCYYVAGVVGEMLTTLFCDALL